MATLPQRNQQNKTKNPFARQCFSCLLRSIIAAHNRDLHMANGFSPALRSHQISFKPVRAVLYPANDNVTVINGFSAVRSEASSPHHHHHHSAVYVYIYIFVMFYRCRILCERYPLFKRVSGFS